ncbi:MAG: VPLPA-CTERM sorting domain-containing protein [Paracoccaceae bacterium]
MFKKIALAATLAFGVSSADAATLATVLADPLLDVVTGTGSGSAGTPGASNFFMSGAGALGATVLPVVSFSDTSGSATDIFTSNLASGAVLEVGSGAGYFEALYDATAASGAFAGFDLFVLRVTTGSVDPFGVPGGTTFSNAAFSVTGVTEQTTPIPLPASLPLMAAGLGGIAVMSRRRKAQKAA